MRYIPTAIKVIVNMFFYCIYAIIAMLFGGWFYGFILSNKWLAIPESDNPIYFKIAIWISTLVLVLTFFFRKYFYISVLLKLNNTPVEKSKTNTSKIIKQKPTQAERIILNQDEIEIFIDKEIK